MKLLNKTYMKSVIYGSITKQFILVAFRLPVIQADISSARSMIFRNCR